MIRFFFFLSTITLLFRADDLYASTYDDNALEIFSKIIPRFVLMSSQKNTIQNQMEICVLHDKLDERYANSLIDKIQKNYPNGIKNYTIKLTRSDYGNIDKCRKSQLTFLFNTDQTTINNSIHFFKKNSILTMSYDAGYLENGIDVTLYLGRNVVPYVNISALRRSGVELDNGFVQISKIYTKGDGR